MKLGKIVAVCHDGKWSRKVKGTVVGTKNGYRIKVRFINPGTGKEIEFWFRKRPTVHYRKELKEYQYVSVVHYRQYACYEGWVGIDWWTPFFTIHKWRD